MINLKKLNSELWSTMTEYATSPRCGFPENEVKDYFFIDVTDDSDRYVIEVRAELSYDSMIDLTDELDEVVRKYDRDAYFDMVSPGIAEAVIEKDQGKVEGMKLKLKENYDTYTWNGVDEVPESVVNVIIEDGVEEISPWAFHYIDSLISVTIPDSVKVIGDSAFGRCHFLKSITIPDSVTYIGVDAFEGCRSLTSIEIPDSVTEIDHGAFKYCDSLTSIKISNSIKEIETGVFLGCDSLTSVTIPESVTEVDPRAFYKCSSLESVTIPSDCRYYRDSFPEGCEVIRKGDKVESMKLKESQMSVFDYGIEYEWDGVGKVPEDVVSVIIEDGVSEIEYAAFRDCKSLTSVTIPNSVTEIGNMAFEGCTSLESITIPGSVTKISNAAFYNCKSLKTVTIKEGLQEIGYYAFWNCKSLTSITIPNSVTNIYECAFKDTSLKSVVIPPTCDYCVNYLKVYPDTRSFPKDCKVIRKGDKVESMKLKESVGNVKLQDIATDILEMTYTGSYSKAIELFDKYKEIVDTDHVIDESLDIEEEYDNPFASRNKVQKKAFDNACDMINKGYGKGSWLKKKMNLGLSKEISDEIWDSATDYMN